MITHSVEETMPQKELKERGVGDRYLVEGEEEARVKDPLPAMNFALVGLKLKEFLQPQKLNFSNFLVPKGWKKIKNKWKLFKIS